MPGKKPMPPVAKKGSKMKMEEANEFGKKGPKRPSMASKKKGY